MPFLVQMLFRISRELVIHLGETIEDIPEDRGIIQAELAAQTGVLAVYASNVIEGKKNISAKFAGKLSGTDLQGSVPMKYE